MRFVVTAVLMLAITGCANTGLRDLRGSGDGPDEFIINPAKPLETPESYAALPAPTPGANNITDPTPLQDGAVVVGGRRTSAAAAVPARDGAVVSHASRFGVTRGIRSQLASEDEDFRKRRGRLTQYRIVPVDRYNQVYKRQAIDPDRVATQYRRAGVPTPTAPPSN
ncbi:DUF3035 domain-containing protein [Ascidiaceihabitans sp.]|uniref:DUF3035 domain-containing protein n=1 Tax=Ascidiaceihabitans sp. TaxID=1872644 RepID=UPI003299E4E4